MTSSKDLVQSVVLAVGLIAIALGLAWAARVGAIPGDWPTRVTMILSTLMISYFGNTIPKVILRSPSARRARRFAGWAFVLSGLVAAALWAFAPLEFATPVSMAVISGTIILVFGYCLLSRSQSVD